MIPSTLLKTLILFALIALFGVGSFGQVTTRVEGTIIGADGKPVQGAEIKFERTDIRANYSIKTNRDGKFNYATLPQGVYTITVTVDGKVIVSQPNIRTNPANPIPLNIDMRELQKQQEAAAPPVAEPRKPTAEELAEFEKKKKEYEEAMAKDKVLQETFSAAMQAREAKNWNLAIENFIKASELDPTQEAVWANLADTYTMRAEGQRGAAAIADYGRAADAYAKAVALKPGDASLHNNYATVAARSQRMDIAQAELAKAIELDPPGAAKYYRNLGTVYFDTNQSAPAEAAFRKAIELDPRNPDAYYRLGLVLVQAATVEGDKMKAPPGTAEAFQKYLELAPNGPNAAEAKSMLDVMGAPVRSNLKR
jgi:Tfp pilus assembly protein PilF